MLEKSSMPAYERIAIDIASRIYHGHFAEGQKIHGRSTLASEYNVSSETVRKAIKILEDVGIVHSEKGSGVIISSKENAFKYINRFSSMKSLKDLEKQTKHLMKKRDELDAELYQTVEKIIDYTKKLRNTNPLNPIEVEIHENCRHIGKTASEVNFWHNTGGTIVAIKRDEQIIISPGPYATFQHGDVLLVVGDEIVYDRVNHFLQE